MDTIKVKLKTGLQLDGKAQTEAVISESTVGAMLEAREQSEDDTTIGALIIMSQIQSIGDIKGPLDRTLFDKLTTSDLERLQKAADEVDNRGRKDGPAPQPGD